jgi:hypothetical protein
MRSISHPQFSAAPDRLNRGDGMKEFRSGRFSYMIPLFCITMYRPGASTQFVSFPVGSGHILDTYHALYATNGWLQSLRSGTHHSLKGSPS